ncbi:MAG TPA: hypothetical protein DCS07_17135 [Bdellovibrionales bacterium]|nr:hypothetical protein [Bdellovibrionales bacterium]
MARRTLTKTAKRATPSPTESTSAKPDNDSFDAIALDLKDCTRCKLCKQGRSQIVLGEGNPKARLMFVGEAPGEQEDTEGRPFVGRSGQLLDKMIEAIGLTRADVFIANMLKCRPPENRNPEPDEIETCSPYLHRQLEIVKPEIILALGKFASQTLLQTETRISDLRGTFQNYRGAKLMPTFHPAYLLRNPSSKKDAWTDWQTVAKELKLKIPNIKNSAPQ